MTLLKKCFRDGLIVSSKLLSFYEKEKESGTVCTFRVTPVERESDLGEKVIGVHVWNNYKEG